MSTPTLEELAAEVAELREKFSRERGTWPGPDWMRSVTEGLTGLSMQVATQQLHNDRQFAAIIETQDKIKTALERLTSVLERLTGTDGPSSGGTADRGPMTT